MRRAGSASDTAGRRLRAVAFLAGAFMSSPTSNADVRLNSVAGGIYGQGNTVRSMAAAGSDLLQLADDRRLTCRVGLTIYGQLVMEPGDELVLPESEFPKRSIYVLGECQWRDCTVDGVFWLDVGRDAKGTWRNVNIRAGDSGGYPVVYFRSPALSWDGGGVDCFPRAGTPARICIGTRAGYYPGPFTNTVRHVTFRCHQVLIHDWPKQRHDIELTLDGCIIETTGDATAQIVSGVRVADGCSSLFVLKDCIRRHDGVDAPASAMMQRGEVQLAGSGCIVRFVEAGKVTEAKADGLRKAAMTEGNFLSRFTAELTELEAKLDTMSADERLRGTLSFARARLGDLSVMREAMADVGHYGKADTRWAQGLMADINDTLANAPLALTLGSSHNPAPQHPEPPPQGNVTIEDVGDGRLRVRSGASEWIYFRNPKGTQYATFLPESSVRGRPIAGGAYPPFGGPSVRYVQPGGSARMMWEYAWQTRIRKAEGAIAGFEAELAASEQYRVRATWVFFNDLPEAIMCNAQLIPVKDPGPPYPANTLRLQSYLRGDHGRYNGIRLWNDDPTGVRLDYAPNREHLEDNEPEHGFFFGECPCWYYTTLRRGLVVCQFNGYNDWAANPPCGYVVRAQDCEATWTSGSGGLSVVAQLKRMTDARDTDGLNHQALWFEGAGLKCWDNVLNLDDGFNHPCEPLLDLASPGRPRLLLWERAGISRNAEIVVLPRPYAALESSVDWFRGDVCVTLLRDVAANSETDVGVLPITVEQTDTGIRIVNTAEVLRDLWVRVPAGADAKIGLNGHGVGGLVRGDGWAALRCDLPPGATAVSVR